MFEEFDCCHEVWGRGFRLLSGDSRCVDHFEFLEVDGFVCICAWEVEIGVLCGVLLFLFNSGACDEKCVRPCFVQQILLLCEGDVG